MRRLLENGANSSFVNQIVNEDVSPERVAACPITAMQGMATITSQAIATGPGLFGVRKNSQGWDLTDAADLEAIHAARAPHEPLMVEAGPVSYTHLDVYKRQSGPYSIVRHPLYAAELIAVTGGVLSVGSVAAFMLGIVWLMLQIMRARFEEEVLTGTFPEYRDYARAVPMMVPGLKARYLLAWRSSTVAAQRDPEAA